MTYQYQNQIAVNRVNPFLQMAGIQVIDVIESQKYKEKELSRKSVYHFCPYCRERIRRGGLDENTELKPLLKVFYRELCEIVHVAPDSEGKFQITARTGTGIVRFIQQYECQVCRNASYTGRRVITIDDFSAQIGGIKAKKETESTDTDGQFFVLSKENMMKRGFQKQETQSLFNSDDDMNDVVPF